MPSEQTAPLYRIWGQDNIAYGPFELPTLVTWVKQKRVLADSWVYVHEGKAWVKASTIPELKMFFRGKAGTGASPTEEASSELKVEAENLRRIKLFAEMDHAQLESFRTYLEVVKVPQFSHLFRKGEHGDAMYSILEGEVRAMTLGHDGKETTLFTLRAGDSFGEIALLIQAPRTSDIVANEASVLLKMPAAAFDKVIREAPALAAPFLLAISRTITARAIDLGKRYEKAMTSARAVAEIHW